jgi:purine-binding chemotaxis protein CheW
MSEIDREDKHDDGESCDYITVTIGSQLFGLPIEGVHDVFRLTGMTPVPMSRKEIAGVLNMRGRIVTAIDMRRRLDLGEREANESPMAVGIEHRGESYGLVIDEVGDVLRLPVANIEPNPVNLDPRWGRVSSGVQRLEGNLLVILDVARILDMDEEKIAA